MAAVRPFRGWRYNPELVGEIASVLCPPYDLITPEIQESLKQRNPYNVIHLEAGQGLDWSALVEGQYDGAAGLFDAWMRDGILRQDTEACYYLLRHSFPMGGEMRTRLGLVACVGLDDYRNLQVLPHEYTEAPAIRDRVALMKSVSANISPIMSVYRDAEKELDLVFQAVMARHPDVDASDDYGGATALWRVRSPDEQESIQRFFHDRPVYLADGHHRYEASRQYQLDRQAEDPAADASELACNYALMTLISFDDPGLVVLPYHRNLRGLADEALARVVARLNDVFRQEPMTVTAPGAIVAEVERLGRDRQVMATIGPGGTGARLWTLENSAVAPDWGPLSVSEGWVLEEKVLRPELGDATLEHLGFLHDHDEAAEGVASGELQMAFLMKPFPMAAFEGIVGGGQRLPRKSTFFYPKLPTGLVINRLDGKL